MKKLVGMLSILMLNSNFLAQEEDYWKEHIHIKELKERSDKFNVYINTRVGAEVNDINQDEKMALGFKVYQLRLEFRGDLTDKIFYRLRHRLNRSTHNENLDNLSKATDIMYVGFRINDKLSLTAGKMAQEWGGFEYDYNPITIYEYSDFINHLDSFMVGGLLTYIPNDKNQFNINITNSRTSKFDKIYGANTGIKESRIPLTYIFTWSGNFFDGKLKTRWSAGYQQEAENYASKILMLGTRLNLTKFNIFFDYFRADEDLDRLGYAKAIGTTEPLKKVSYNTFITKAEYKFNEKWNVFLQGMYETANVGRLPIGAVDAKRKSFGYIAAVEHMPFKNQDLRFFLNYVGRKYNYKFTELNDNTNRIVLGMVYRIKAF